MSTEARVMTLTDFLLARIAEDEAAANEATRWPWEGFAEDGVVLGFGQNRVAENVPSWDSGHIARHDPARVLAECEAKRRWIDLAYEHAATIDGEWGCCHDAETLRRGYREAMGDWDEDEPIPDTCCALGEVARFLAPLALPYADHPDYRDEWRP